MRQASLPVLAPPVLAAAVLAALCLTGAAPRPLHLFSSLAISADGTRIAAIETDDVPHDGDTPAARLVIHDLAGAPHAVIAGCARDAVCRLSSPTWSADGSRLAFLAERADGRTSIETVGRDGGASRVVLVFDGPLDGLRYGPADRLSVLATAHAHKRIGATAPASVMAGEIGTETDEQRIALVENGALRFVSPPDLYVYEYDWRPDGGFVGTAATGNGDSDWWIARLYGFGPDGARVLFSPGPREQLADPVVSPDGRSVAFVGGWMSDFGSTGGDAYVLALDQPGRPIDLTPNTGWTVTSLDWHCGRGLISVALDGERLRIDALAAGAPPRALWSGEMSLNARGWDEGLACARGGTAAVRESFTAPPEIVAGPIGAWRQVTGDNDGLQAPETARSITWRDDGLDVQGWLLRPKDDARRRPMIVDVHGGPQAAATPEFPRRGVVRDLLDAGWDVFEPNYRGSFGQGEAFAQASIGDLGGGDWRDVLTGVDAAERAAPVDDGRLGIMGASYGGYMTMWAVTQTHRFRAAAADAGVSDWLSIEGEAPQAGSDAVTFGGSVYDNPAPYLRASPVTHMKGVSTPSLITVGDRDAECPMPQSEEFHTALDALGVPSSFVVYPGEGHAITKEADREDIRRRTVAWFARWFDQAGPGARPPAGHGAAAPHT